MQAETAPYSVGKSFDSLAYAKRMESVGFTRQQAETMAEEQAKLIDERLATKQDIASIRQDIASQRESARDDMERFRLASMADIEAVRADIKQSETRLEARIAETRAEILKWVIGLIGLQTFAIIATLLALLRGGGH